VLRFGTRRADIGPGSEWLRPTTIVQPRFARFNVTLNFQPRLA